MASALEIPFYASLFVLGISGKSQVLLALVFTTRYLDLFTVFISTYNTVMKVRLKTITGTHLDFAGAGIL